MTKAKQILKLSPEFYLLAATIYYWTLTANVVNPIAIGLLCIIVFQLVFKKTISGLMISGLFIVLNLYLILALVSELSEFTEASSSYYKLLTVGSLFLGFNIIAGSFMFWKYIKKEIK